MKVFQQLEKCSHISQNCLNLFLMMHNTSIYFTKTKLRFCFFLFWLIFNFNEKFAISTNDEMCLEESARHYTDMASH